MAQKTNLNTSPYFDDFDVNKDYYKVLFKPGYPIQARELTTLQSILQNQIEQFGNHIFKEGSVVIPGNLNYQNPVYAVEIDSSFGGNSISLYFSQLLGKKIKGQTSGVTAEIFYILTNTESVRGNYTLYVKFLTSGGVDFDQKTFVDGETLILQENLIFGNSVIQSGQGVCNTKLENSVSQGSYISLDPGVYFVRGVFARVSRQDLLLDQYGTEPSYKVGFEIEESIVNSFEDASLYDNAQGFSNYAAPGADRFKIKLVLSKRLLTDTDTDNFVEIFRVNTGVPIYNTSSNPTYSIIRNELARRTYDESGDYIVNPFTIYVRDCLNDKYLNSGIYYENQTTAQGNTPSENLMVYQIGPGKAYIQGYEVEALSTRLIDVPKPRTTKNVKNASVSFSAGSLFVLDNTFGSAPVGLGTTIVVSLMDSRLGSDKGVAAGTTIGQARVYDYVPESAYESNTSRMSLRLFDIDTYTNVGLSTSVTLSTPTHIKGKTSNATGFLKQSVSGVSSITLYSVSGQFLENEKLIINGIESNKLINSITDYNLSDIKSVFSKVGVSTFNGDLCLTNKTQILSPGTNFNISKGTGGISTVSGDLNSYFVNKLKSGDIVSYGSTSITGGTPVYHKVNSVSAGGTFFTVSAVTSISGICDGNLPTSAISVTNLVKLNPEIVNKNTGLLTPLPNVNVSNIDLETTTIFQRRLFKNQTVSSSNTLAISISDQDIFFAGFDEDRYVISYTDGTVESIRSDKFSISTDGKTATFIGLSKASTTADVIATIQNIKPNHKIKRLNKVSSLVVDKSIYTSSGIGTTTLNDGLTYSDVYGLRIQDEEISLNVPDVIRILGIYESSNTSTPQIPKIQLSGFSGATNSNLDFLIGEIITGQTTGAVGIIVSRVDSDKLEFCYLNGFQFSLNETILGKETQVQASIIQTYLSDKNLVSNFGFDSGQTLEIYDYAKITRKKSIPEPKRKLKIVFQNYTIDAQDSGEFISINSYPADAYKNNIPIVENFSLSDYIDIRPRVKPYNASSGRSPFEYDNKDLSFEGTYSNYNLVPENNLIVSYDYYLGRIDKVILNTDGTLDVAQGIPSDIPLPPKDKENALTLGIVYNSPYLFDPLQSNVVMREYKRYRMSDIALLENRIQRLEEFTTLSMSEMKVESLTIKDAETGLDRFKSGFFVDNFQTQNVSDIQNPQFSNFIGGGLCTPEQVEVIIPLQLGSSAINGFTSTYDQNVDQSFVSDLGSPGIKKTGDLITLNYTEVTYNQQEYATTEPVVTPVTEPVVTPVTEPVVTPVTEPVVTPIIEPTVTPITPPSQTTWRGTITLFPSQDTWYDERSIEISSFAENTIVNDVEDKEVVIQNNVTEEDTVWTPKPNVRTRRLSKRKNSLNKKQSSGTGDRYDTLGTVTIDYLALDALKKNQK